MVGDHIVQLAGDARPLVKHRLASCDIPLALGDLCAVLAVAHHAVDQQEHDECDDGELRRLVQA